MEEEEEEEGMIDVSPQWHFLLGPHSATRTHHADGSARCRGWQGKERRHPALPHVRSRLQQQLALARRLLIHAFA